jgi:hypothetical protein
MKHGRQFRGRFPELRGPSYAKRNRTCDELVVDRMRGRAMLPSSLSYQPIGDRGGPQV